MDIRKYFSPINKKPSLAPQQTKEKKRKKVIESDDEEDPLPSRSRKNKVLSDSDDDIFEVTPKVKANHKPDRNAKPSLLSSKAQQQQPQTRDKKKPSSSLSKLKPISVTDYFGSISSSSSQEKKTSANRKVENVDSDADEAFKRTLQQLDTEATSKKPKQEEDRTSLEAKAGLKNTPTKKEKKGSRPSKEVGRQIRASPRKRESTSPSPRKRLRESSHSSVEEVVQERGSSAKKAQKSRSSPRKAVRQVSPSPRKGVRQASPSPKKEVRESTPPRKVGQESSVPSSTLRTNGIREPAAKLAQKMKVDKARLERFHYKAVERQKNPPDEGTSTPKKEKVATPVKESSPQPKKKVVTPVKEASPKPKKERVVTPVKESSPKPKKMVKEEISHSPATNLKPEITPDADEQKKQRAMAYRKFLQRTGPKNPGGKPLPEGLPNCLSGLTFVLTGVLETIDRDETAELIKKYGGKVTTTVSRNTSFLVVGDDPGASKTKKAEQLGTKFLDEDELFKLIETRVSKDTIPPPQKTKAKTEEKVDVKSEQRFRTPDDSPARSSSLHHSPSSEKTSSSATTSHSSLSSPRLGSSSQGSSIKDNWSSPQSSLSSPSSSKGSSQGAELPSTQEMSSRGPEDACLWVDKYRPATLKNIIGQQGEQSNAKKLLRWLRDWSHNHSGNKKKLPAPSPWSKDNTGAYYKAALLSGPPGVGKSTTAHVVCRELGFDVVELNASDTRSKRALAEEVSELLSSTSLAGFAFGCSGSEGAPSRNHVLVMDEVDGMAGNEDRGGVQELIALIKGTRTPVICLCNDRNHPKIRSLANHCFDLRFQRPRIEQIRGAMMTVCFREGVKIRPEALDRVITGSNRDVRQVLHHLSLWSAAQKDLDTDVVAKDAKLAKKDIKMGPWDVCSQVFSASARKEMSIHDKVSLFFHDYSIGPLFVQENYLKVSPDCARGNRAKLLEQVAKTAQVLADSDIVDKAIRHDSAWSLLPTQAIFSSVCPGEYMAGHFSAQVEFPSWLGKNSSRNKFDRLAQEIQMHTRLRTSGSKQDIIMDYCPSLRDALMSPLAERGLEGVKEAVDLMTSYDLLREDWDTVVELSSWSGKKDPRTAIESKVKAAFTRTFNKESRPSPFAVVAPAPRKGAAGQSYGVEDIDISEEDDDEEGQDEDLSKNPMIKPGKLSQKKEEGKKATSTSSKGKGKGKGGGRGANR